MQKLFHYIISAPLLILAADLWLSAIDLLLQFTRQGRSREAILSSKIPLALQDIQMVQVAGNMLMALIITLAILSFISFSYKVSSQQIIRLNGLTIISLLIVLAYTVPGLWSLFSTLMHLFKEGGTLHLSASKPWYTIVALCQPYAIFLWFVHMISYLLQRRHYKLIDNRPPIYR